MLLKFIILIAFLISLIASNIVIGGYTIKDKIGEGSEGYVYTAVNPKYPQKDLVLKIFKDEEHKPNEFTHWDFISKIDIYADHILRPLHLFKADKSYCAVYPRMKTDLFTLVNNRIINKIIWPLDEIRKIARHLLTALEKIHSSGYLHLDLKLENVMVKGGKYYLADLGFLEPKNKKEYYGGGSTCYWPPETLKNAPKTEKFDTWGLGRILYFLTDTRVGCPKHPTPRTIKRIHRHLVGRRNPKLKKQLEIILDSNDNNYQKDLEEYKKYKDLVNGLLEKDPKKRLSAKEALGHPFLQSHDDLFPKLKINTRT